MKIYFNLVVYTILNRDIIYNVDHMRIFQVLNPDYSPSTQSIYTNLNADIENIQNWCAENCMFINENKSKCILIGISQRIARGRNSPKFEIAQERYKIKTI